MKRCPKCGATGTDDDVFCELDGARLLGEGERVTISAVPSTPRQTIPCPACGTADAKPEDGYCSVCGHRVDSGPEPPVPLGSVVGSYTAHAPRGFDDVLARASTGEIVLLALGDTGALGVEASALQTLASREQLPRVIELGRDPRRGAFLALTPPGEGARPLSSDDPVDCAVRLREILDLVAAIERAGHAWEPHVGDVFVLPDGSLTLLRLRRARPLTVGERVDARAVLESLGSAFLPEPAARGPSRLLRMMVVHQGAEGGPRHVDAMRAELDAVEKLLASRDPDPDPDLGEECDPGLRREYNEDACASARGTTAGEPWAVLVVCDGVSASTHAEQASTIAAKTARDTLEHFASGDIRHEAAANAVAQAIRAAHLAVCTHALHSSYDEPPGTTIVAALVYRRRLTVGWVGDSRAYWVSPTGSELLTRDHSWATEVVARGEMTEAEAMRAPLAHALTRCLGPLEVGSSETTIPEIEPEVRQRDLPGEGYVILCSDGLWNYFPQAADLAALVKSMERAPAAPLARFLVNQALAKGGQDNVTVAVLAHRI